MKKPFFTIMKNFRFAFACACALLFTYGSTQAQCVVTLNPTADTYAFSRGNPNEVNNNFGTRPGLPIGTWTWGGVPGSVRSFLQFNVAAIPANATITAATLNLFTDVKYFITGGDEVAGGGTDAAILNPVAAAWAENALTWNNQPAVGATAVALAQSIANNQTYSLNVLAMVQNMYANPATNFGFRIKQNVEAQYGMLVFGSRENANPALRPTLVVTYTVPAPTPTFITAPPAPVCSGTTVDYSVNAVANATNYTWKIDGVTVSSTVTPTYSKTWSAAEAGHHVVTVTVTACGSTSSALKSHVKVVALPIVPAITGNTTVCVNQYTPLSNTVSGGVWSSSNTGVATVNSFGLVQGVSAGTAVISYTVTGSGCSTTVTATVTVNGTLVFVINGPSPLCPNTSGNAYSVSPAVAGADYTWNIQNAPSVGVNFPVNGSTNTELSIPSGLTGQFILRCQGLNSCGASQIVSKTITISTDVPPTPDVTCSGTSGTNTCTNLVVSNFGTNTIEWIVGGVVQSTSPTFNRPLSTSVLCTYTSASGCKASTWYSPAVTCTYAARLAQDIDLPLDKPFLIYPNPAKGVFTIQTKNQEGTASIYDVAGQLVRKIELSTMQNTYTVEIETAGMYIIHVKTATETKGYKIVVE
jgi:hypothetical protein